MHSNSTSRSGTPKSRRRSRSNSVSSSHSTTRQGTRVQVFVRARPAETSFATETSELTTPLEFPSDKEIKLIDPKQETTYRFDHVFPPDTTNKEVCHVISTPLIDSVLQGYNGSFMVYGQTGTGKTFTVHAEDGLIPTTIASLFERIQADKEFEYSVYLSYLQIYHERIYDLLESAKDTDLHLREHPEEGIMIEGLSECNIQTTKDAESLLEYGRRQLFVAETKMVRSSSRSHSLCILRIQKKRARHEIEKLLLTEATIEIEPDAFRVGDSFLKGKLYLCDLAGSERLKKSGVTGERWKEARYINTSLLELGNVIHALSTAGTHHVPFRNSTLTRILKESLGGNSRASLMICVSSSMRFISETKCSLNFGQRALRVTKTSSPNVEPSGNEEANMNTIDYKALSEYLAKKLKELELAYHHEKQNFKNMQDELKRGRKGPSKIPVLTPRSRTPTPRQESFQLMEEILGAGFDLLDESERRDLITVKEMQEPFMTVSDEEKDDNTGVQSTPSTKSLELAGKSEVGVKEPDKRTVETSTDELICDSVNAEKSHMFAENYCQTDENSNYFVPMARAQRKEIAAWPIDAVDSRQGLDSQDDVIKEYPASREGGDEKMVENEEHSSKCSKGKQRLTGSTEQVEEAFSAIEVNNLEEVMCIDLASEEIRIDRAGVEKSQSVDEKNRLSREFVEDGGRTKIACDSSSPDNDSMGIVEKFDASSLMTESRSEDVLEAEEYCTEKGSTENEKNENINQDEINSKEKHSSDKPSSDMELARSKVSSKREQKDVTTPDSKINKANDINKREDATIPDRMENRMVENEGNILLTSSVHSTEASLSNQSTDPKREDSNSNLDATQVQSIATGKSNEGFGSRIRVDSGIKFCSEKLPASASGSALDQADSMQSYSERISTEETSLQTKDEGLLSHTKGSSSFCQDQSGHDAAYEAHTQDSAPVAGFQVTSIASTKYIESSKMQDAPPEDKDNKLDTGVFSPQDNVVYLQLESKAQSQSDVSSLGLSLVLHSKSQPSSAVDASPNRDGLDATRGKSIAHSADLPLSTSQEPATQVEISKSGDSEGALLLGNKEVKTEDGIETEADKVERPPNVGRVGSDGQTPDISLDDSGFQSFEPISEDRKGEDLVDQTLRNDGRSLEESARQAEEIDSVIGNASTQRGDLEEVRIEASSVPENKNDTKKLPVANLAKEKEEKTHFDAVDSGNVRVAFEGEDRAKIISQAREVGGQAGINEADYVLITDEEENAEEEATKKLESCLSKESSCEEFEILQKDQGDIKSERISLLEDDLKGNRYEKTERPILEDLNNNKQVLEFKKGTLLKTRIQKGEIIELQSVVANDGNDCTVRASENVTIVDASHHTDKRRSRLHEDEVVVEKEGRQSGAQEIMQSAKMQVVRGQEENAVIKGNEVHLQDAEYIQMNVETKLEADVLSTNESKHDLMAEIHSGGKPLEVRKRDSNANQCETVVCEDDSRYFSDGEANDERSSSIIAEVKPKEKTSEISYQKEDAKCKHPDVDEGGDSQRLKKGAPAFKDSLIDDNGIGEYKMLDSILCNEDTENVKEAIIIRNTEGERYRPISFGEARIISPSRQRVADFEGATGIATTKPAASRKVRLDDGLGLPEVEQQSSRDGLRLSFGGLAPHRQPSISPTPSSASMESDFSLALKEKDKLQKALSTVKGQYEDLLQEFDRIIANNTEETGDEGLQISKESYQVALKCKEELELEIRKAREQLAMVQAVNEELSDGLLWHASDFEYSEDGESLSMDTADDGMTFPRETSTPVPHSNSRDAATRNPSASRVEYKSNAVQTDDESVSDYMVGERTMPVLKEIGTNTSPESDADSVFRRSQARATETGVFDSEADDSLVMRQLELERQPATLPRRRGSKRRSKALDELNGSSAKWLSRRSLVSKEQAKKTEKITLQAIENAELKKELLLTKLEKIRLEAMLSCVMMRLSPNEVEQDFRKISLNSITSSGSTLRSTSSLTNIAQADQTSPFQPTSPFRRLNPRLSASVIGDDAKSSQRVRFEDSRKTPSSMVSARSSSLFGRSSLLTQSSMSPSSVDFDLSSEISTDFASTPVPMERVSPCGQDGDDKYQSPSSTKSKHKPAGKSSEAVVAYSGKNKLLLSACLPFRKKKKGGKDGKRAARESEDDSYGANS